MIKFFASLYILSKSNLACSSQTGSLRTPGNMFVVNLAVSDLIMMTTMGLPVVVNGFTQRYWMWGKLWCRVRKNWVAG